MRGFSGAPDRLIAGLIVRLFATSLLASLAACESPSSPSSDDVVVQFMSAYNDHDIDGMLSLADPDIRWMSVKDARISIESAGKTALADLLELYFKEIPSARSEILLNEASGNFVMTVEKALWTNANGEEKDQCSNAVYELRDGLIANVWYFSPYPCDQ